MNRNYLFFIELLIFNGSVLAWAFWELWSLRKSRRDAKPPETEPDAKPSQEGTRHPEG